MHPIRLRPPTARVLTVAMLIAACSTAEPREAPPLARAPAQPSTSVASPVATPTPVSAVYPWGPSARDRLDLRFTPPAGFTRAPVASGGFGDFLRTLPLLPEGSPVVDFRNNRLYADGRHPNIVAVADLDVGNKDLQHCADVVIRLHAEWRYGRGDRDLSYRSVSGQPLSYLGYASGDRAFAAGNALAVRRVAKAKKDEHAVFREWLDEVFAWAGTASLERDAQKVASITDVRPGDFFVMSGLPFGHAVLVLDVAKDATGRTALLLGQSYMPAQRFHILRPGEASSWFIVEPGDAVVATPFWRPFPTTALRRFG